MSVALLWAMMLGAAPTWPVEPEVGVAFAMTRQVLMVSGGSSGEALRAPTRLTSLSLGVSYAPWVKELVLRSSLLVGLGSLDAHVTAGVQQQAVFRRELLPWLGLEGGVMLAAQLDATTPNFSSAQVGLALGVRVWRFELAWLPALQLPLGRSEVTAGDVTVTQRMATAVVPVSLALRVDLAPSDH